MCFQQGEGPSRGLLRGTVKVPLTALTDPGCSSLGRADSVVSTLTGGSAVSDYGACHAADTAETHKQVGILSCDWSELCNTKY